MVSCIIPATWPAHQHVHAITTTRVAGPGMPGHSNGVYASFNLAAHVDDLAKAVKSNREMLRQLLALPAEPIWLDQTHSHQVIEARNNDVLHQADASWTSRPDIVCAVLTADCLPVFFTNRGGSVVAIAHAGWRGLCDGVISATLNASGIHPEDCLVWLGPAISQQNFEVGVDVYERFSDKDKDNAQAFVRQDSEHWLCNLYQLACIELEKRGVKNIFGGDFCTYADRERFYSFRRDGQTGRMASLIWIKR